MKKLVFLFALLFATPTLAATDIQSLNIGKGSQVWFVEDHTVPIVAMSITFPAGSAYDPKGKPGLASFTAALIDEGAGELNSRAFHDALAARAIRFSASVERDNMVVSITTLKENLPEALRLLQMALTRPRFENSVVQRVRTQIIQGLEQGQTEPATVARRAFMTRFFNGHSYGHAGNGEIDSIFAITTDDLRAFAKNHWVKGGLKISVAGDIAAPVLTRLLADAFKAVPATTPRLPPPVGKLGQPGTHVTRMAVPQPAILFGLPGIMRHDPDFIPGYVANYILGGGGFSSRLMEEIRNKRGLTYGVSTSLNSFNRASVMLGSVQTRANAVRQTLQVVKETMTKFAEEGPTQTELDDAKTYLTGSFPIAFSSNAGIASQLSTFQRQGLDITYVARRNAMIQAVTLEDVKRVGKKLFDPARLTVVVAGTPQEGRSPQVSRAPVRPAPAPMVGTSPAPAPVAGTAAPKPAPVPKPATPAPARP